MQDDELEDSDEDVGPGAPLRNAKELAGMKVLLSLLKPTCMKIPS